MLPSKKIKGSSPPNLRKEKEEGSREGEREREGDLGMGNRNNEGKGGKKRRSESSLIYDGLYYTYATSRQGFCRLALCAVLHFKFAF